MFDPKTRVLIVDNMMCMRNLLEEILEGIGFTDVTEAGDGFQAWEAIKSAPIPFGLIISDWNMPNCTGIDLLKCVRSDKRFKKTPFVMFTAESEQHQVANALKAGVDQYVVKPCTRDQFVLMLELVHNKYSGARE